MAELIVHGRLQRGDLDLDVDLTVVEGVTAIVGANGAGKTSLLRAIAGLEAMTTGQIVIDRTAVDRPSSGIFVAAEQRDVAMAFQEPRLFPHLSVLDNIAYPRRRQGRATAAARDDARAAASRLGLDQLLDLRPRDLSGGQAQRVNVARALVGEATTLLLDEPLASIDDGSRAEFRELLRSAPSQRILWVTHDPTDLSHADRVLPLDDVVQTDPR